TGLAPGARPGAAGTPRRGGPPARPARRGRDQGATRAGVAARAHVLRGAEDPDRRAAGEAPALPSRPPGRGAPGDPAPRDDPAGDADASRALTPARGRQRIGPAQPRSRPVPR